jgi:SPP1 gp7 family putative phage head morphogenesis protein
MVMTDPATVRALMALARAQVTKARPTQLEVLARLTAWFASKEAIHASQLPDGLIDALVALGLDRQAVTKVGEMVLGNPLSGRSRHGSPAPFEGMPATRRVAAQEPRMRARYVLAAARRLTQGLADRRYNVALDAEQRYLDAHVAAGRKRRAVARRVDELGGEGHVLVWRTAGDERVTPECRALEGRLFTAENPPGGQLPGAVHPRCRCHAEQWGRGPFLQWGVNAPLVA